MDVVLSYADEYVLTPYVYSTSWPEDNPLRQILSLFLLTNIGGYVLYFIAATLSYWFLFDKRLLRHPLILKNQIRREIIYTCKSIPVMSAPTISIFFLEVRGYGKLYDNVGDTRLGWFGIILSVATFILFTDMCIYWIHRGLHHKQVYKYIHKAHHTWKVPTPFASHAFHPVDGFLQSCPYHIYPFLFPLHKFTYLGLFVFVNFWTVSIHDGYYRVPDTFKPIVNGSAHHTDHHLFYNFNYGQFFTLWDRIGKTFRNPSAFEGNGPMVEALKAIDLTDENKNTTKNKAD
ncbi:lathosterol oxidase-like [Mytilus edulis]|uniref:lathosterol oxidase-like n=1 Tax=Mytilus edulis TaxID=6550 RepID=UPI0039F0BC3A